MAHEIQQVVLYARVSTVEQAERDLSLPAQLGSLQRYAADRGYTVIAEYIEPGASGRDDNRRTFKRMMEDIMAPSAKIDAVLVVHTSRFMRDAGKAFLHKQALAKRGVRVVSISQETNDDPSGQLMQGIFASFDQYESDMNGYRTRAAMRENAQRGFSNGSSAPYGFVARSIDESARGRRRLFPDAEEATILREVFRLYISQTGAKATARELTLRGLHYRNRQLWNKNLVLKVIGEPAAIGTFYWGRTETRSKRRRERAEWIEIEVEPIIDRELFDAAQQVRAARDPERTAGRTSSSPLLLAGLVKCGECDASYVLETSGKLNADGEYAYRYYNCRSFLKTGKEACRGRRFTLAKLDRAVLEHLADHLFSIERCRALVQDVMEESGTLRRKTDEQRQELQRQVADLDRRIAKWQDAFETDADSADVVLPRLRELQSKRAELHSQIVKVVPLRPAPPHLFTDATAQRFQAVLRTLLLGEDQTLAKNYLRFLVEDITVHGNEIEIRGKSESAVALLASSSDP
ncbi:MAG: hypothetical protein RL701_7842, partial [Pseudomonadota bacterium]